MRLVIALGSGNGAVFAGEFVLYAVGITVKVIDSADEHVVGNIIQVTTELEPRASHGNMVGGTFTFSFDEQFEAAQIGAFPCRERIEQLQARRFRINLYFNAAAVFCRRLVTGILNRIT